LEFIEGSLAGIERGGWQKATPIFSELSRNGKNFICEPKSESVKERKREKIFSSRW